MRQRRRSIPRLAGVAALGALLSLACRYEEPCGSLAPLCADAGRWRTTATRVHDAVVLDFDGDGEDEAVVLSRSSWLLALGYGDGWSSTIHFDREPVGLEALPGEVAVALSEPPQIEVFGVDDRGRLARRRTIPLSESPAALRACDLAGDGEPELIASLPERGRLAVVDPYAGDVREYPAGSRPSALAVGDVDGDARPDVVVVDEAAGALQVLRGAGDGRLLRPSPSPSSPQALWLELADHDGDGDLDAVTRDETNVRVHHNDGGRLASPSALAIAGDLPTGAGLVVGPAATNGLTGIGAPVTEKLRTWFGKGAAFLGHSDRYLREPVEWVGPGRDELVLVGGSRSLTRLRWGSSASVIEVWSSELGPWIGTGPALATGDLDGDHLLDFAATTGDTLRLFRGRADLGFESMAQFELDDYATAVAIADVTGDGRPEVVVNEQARARVFFRDDDGQFGAGLSFAPSVPPQALVALRTGPDQPVVIVAWPRPSFGLTETPGATLLRFAGDYTVALGELAEGLHVDALVAVDVDEDGVDEPLILGRRDGTVVLTRMTPAGEGFAPGPEHDLAALSGLPLEPDIFAFLAAADLDGDGEPEAFIDAPGGRLRIEGLADDAPQATFEEQLPPTDLRDVDGDGQLDAVYLFARYFYYYHGHGDGTFETELRGHMIRDNDAIFAADPAAQFDLLTLSNVVSAYLTRDTMSLRGAGDTFGFPGPAAEFVRADLDLDGLDDIVTMSADGGIAAMWGSETDPLERAESLDEHGMAVGDLDGDGRPEVLWLDGSGLYAQRAFPRRQEPELVLDDSEVGWIVRLVIADVDADARADLVALRVDDDQIALEVAHGTAEPLRFAPWRTIATVSEYDTAAMQIGDADGDGNLDVLVDPATTPSVLVRGLGSREWAEPEPLPGERALFSRAGADGRVDLLTQDGATIHRHTGGDPGRRSPLVTVDAAVLVGAADADGDGRYDLAVTDGERTSVWLLGDDGPTRVSLLEAPFDAVAVDFPDLDGDGRPDLVALSSFGDLFIRRTRARVPAPAP
ncbi:VCBS repeat-containing protein [Nannocystis sp. SCPEA4]|uniref:FG-GAP-like repeat-containing protein n=1 Tax=Nannocystis sp. SCPEA4 TaxID=2996787 RepID=UPI00226FC4EF|nr:VCBS repeat-containing protein [Nannocystis sp. SCPEA4]MCY1062718.1 VCBS repeat-containing protein [Nannocystis sp. SCPEA4]